MPRRRKSSGPIGSWLAPTIPTSTRRPMPRSGSRRSPRRMTCCPIRRRAAATTHSGMISGRCRRGSTRKPGHEPEPERARAGAGSLVAGRPPGRRGCGSTSGRVGLPRASISRIFSAVCSAVAAAAAGDPSRERTRSSSSSCRSRRPTRAGVAGSRSPAPTAPRASRSPSRPVSPTGSGSGWPARAGGGPEELRQAICTW
jgi:hypothetical protein